MNTPWEREVARALRLAHAVLQAAPALPGAVPARALAADPAARFDAVLAGLLQLPDAAPPNPSPDDVLPFPAASPFAAAPERRDGAGGVPPSAVFSSSGAAHPAVPPSPLHRVPVSRLFGETDASRSTPSAGGFDTMPMPPIADPRGTGFDPFGGLAAPQGYAGWTELEGWASAPSSPSPLPPSPSSKAETGRAVDGWTPATPPSSPAFPAFAWEDAPRGSAQPAAWDTNPPRGAGPDAGQPTESDPPAFPGVRVARSTADLRALLQAHVASTDPDAPPAFPPLDAGPAVDRLAAADRHPTETGFPAPRPDTAADRLLPPSAGGVPAVALPDAGGAAYFPAFPGADEGTDALAEEMLLERLMDRMEARARDDSVRRFGLTGGF